MPPLASAPPPHTTTTTPPPPAPCPLRQVMREFGFLVRVCTAREATNFGIFLNEVFGLVERWRVRGRRQGGWFKRAAVTKPGG